MRTFLFSSPKTFSDLLFSSPHHGDLLLGDQLPYLGS
jgi:hypothetical protein